MDTVRRSGLSVAHGAAAMNLVLAVLMEVVVPGFGVNRSVKESGGCGSVFRGKRAMYFIIALLLFANRMDEVGFSSRSTISHTITS